MSDWCPKFRTDAPCVFSATRHSVPARTAKHRADLAPGSMASYIFILWIPFPAPAQRQGEQANRVHHIGLAAIVLADQYCQGGAEADGHVVARPESRNFQAPQMHSVSSIGPTGRGIFSHAAPQHLAGQLPGITRDSSDQLRPDALEGLHRIVGIETHAGGKQGHDVLGQAAREFLQEFEPLLRIGLGRELEHQMHRPWCR